MSVTNKRGIFSIIDVRERQASGNWSVKSDVWVDVEGLETNFATGDLESPKTGYIAGGRSPECQSTVHRINYSIDS